MATKAYVDQLLNALDANIRGPIRSSIWYLMDNWRLGDGTRAVNAQWYQVTGRTNAVANAEFAVRHGIGATPKWLIPVLDVTAQNAQLVPLTVSRSSDGAYIYLKSSSADAPFTCFLEA